jgi:hypothetical protein
LTLAAAATDRASARARSSRDPIGDQLLADES